MAGKLDDFYFSASALGTFDSCALRFKYRYIDNLYWSREWGAPGEEQAAAERGRLFHLLAQRYYSGLDPEVPVGHPWAPDLTRWLTSLRKFCPRREGAAYYPELELRLDLGGTRLMGKYDLLVVSPDGSAVIYDWKTERKMPLPRYLSRSMQTLVYRYLLCAAGAPYHPQGVAFDPARVQMVYWNPAFPAEPLGFGYDTAQFEMHAVKLRNLITDLRTRAAEMFLATTAQYRCRLCEYRPLCHGQRWELAAEEEELGEELEEVLAWELAPEIPF